MLEKEKVMEALKKQASLCKKYYNDAEFKYCHKTVCDEYNGMKAIAKIIGITEDEIAEIEKNA